MEFLFENRYIRNEEWAKDIYYYFYFCRVGTVVPSILFFAVLLIGVFCAIAFNRFYWAFFVYPVLWMALLFVLYRCNVKSTLKKDLQAHGEAVQITSFVSDAAVRVEKSTAEQSELLFADVKKAVFTDRFIFLWSKTNAVYSFKKDGFSVGDEEGFVAFLEAKGFKVK